MSMIRAQAIIRGMVQGVYFRAHTRDEAKAYHVTGWVKNRRDGGERPFLKATKKT